MHNVTQDWDVDAMPTFVFLKDGTIVDKVVGTKKKELHQKKEKHICTDSA